MYPDAWAFSIYFKSAAVSTYPMYTRYRPCTPGSGHVHRVQAMYTGYRPRTPGTGHVHRVQATYTGYRPCTPGTGHVHRVQAMYTGYRPCAPGTGHVHRVQAMCTGYRPCTPGTGHVHRVQAMCTGYRPCAPGTDHVHRVQATYTGVHGHLLTGCLPIVTTNITCASAEHLAIACKYFVWLYPTTVLRGKVTVCCHGVQVSCTPFRHGTWEIDTCNVAHEGEAWSIPHVPCLNGVQL